MLGFYMISAYQLPICDADAGRSKKMADLYNTNLYLSVDELLQRERSLDACIVCTPTKTHSIVAKKVIESGINIFVEKPLSFSTIECEEMVSAAGKKGVILTSGYIERFNPAVQDFKQIIDRKQYGDLIMMEFHRENRMPLHIRDVGIIYDTSVHDIDTAMFLFNGTPNMVFARAGKKFHSYEDFATIMLGFANQKVAIISFQLDYTKKGKNVQRSLYRRYNYGRFYYTGNQDRSRGCYSNT